MAATQKKEVNSLLGLLVFLVAMVFLNVFASYFYQRIDLTKEKRFSISDASKSMMNDLEDIVTVKMYLEGDFPAEFRQLRNSTKETLEAFKAYAGDNLQYEFFNPADIEDTEQRQELYLQLSEKGLPVQPLILPGSDSYSEQLIVPGMLVSYRGREMPISLLVNQKGMSPEESINASISQLEFKLGNTIEKLSSTVKKTIAFTNGNGELNDYDVKDLAMELEKFYLLRRLDLREQIEIPSDIDLMVIAKPTKPFTEQDKFKIDQYVMHGGKIIWMIDPLVASLDSIGVDQEFTTINYDLNLDDLLFKYGVRINDVLVQDLQCNPIAIMIGEIDGAPQTQLYAWPFHPILAANTEHPIGKNIGLLQTDFASYLDTVKAVGLKKEILLSSSEYSRYLRNPVRVALDEIKQRPDPSIYNKKYLPIAIMLEGSFSSLFSNKLTAKSLEDLSKQLKRPVKKSSVPNKMMVIADGDFIKNAYNSKGEIMPLGYNRFAEVQYDNKSFALNSIEYLLDNSGLIETRSKEYKIRLLDKGKIQSERTKWQVLNIVVPIAVIMLFGLLYRFIRKRKYATK